MRHLNHIVQRRATKYVLLIEHPRDPRYTNDVIAFYYLSYEDLRKGPSGAEVFHTWPVEYVKAYLEDECGFDPTTWQVIPDAEPGEPQDRIAEDCAISAVTVIDQVRHRRRAERCRVRFRAWTRG